MTDHIIVMTIVIVLSLYLPRFICTYYSDCYEDFSDSTSIFLYQPCNITLYEGEDTELNCTPAQRSGLQIATWIIDGKRYYWVDFMSISIYSFDLYDNSLTIHNTSRNLDGSSYQCVINRRASRIAYLTVLYTLTFTSQQSTGGVSTTPRESSTTPTIPIPTTLLTPGPPGNDIVLNSKKTQNTLLIASSVGITCLIVVIIILSIVITLALKFHNITLRTSTDKSESFTMNRNELYGQLNRKHTLVSLTRNQLYEHRHNYLSSR